MSAAAFYTSNDNFTQLFTRGDVFKIPRFQRDYSWKEENWADLWSDIVELVSDNEPKSSHYMGYLVLQRRSNSSVDIIDGQQRMTTFSILVLACLRILTELASENVDAQGNQRRIEEIRRTYIGHLDTVSLNVTSKLTLNRNNNDYYQNHLVSLNQMPQRGYKASEHLMRKATEWFLRTIRSFLNTAANSKEDWGKVIAKLVTTVSSGLFFTVIFVDDDLNAYKVFETLNARGVKLASPDLLKNYVFSVVSNETDDSDELDRIESRWGNILDKLKDDNVSSFLRAYWGSSREFVREKELFKVIKEGIADRAKAFDFLRELEYSLDDYVSLSHPDDSGWPRVDKDNVKLLKMFNVRLPFPLLMAAKKAIPHQFSDILDAIVKVTFRYNTILNGQANEQERIYSKVAIGISRGELKSANDVIRELKSVYPNDLEFQGAFIAKEMDTSNSRKKNIAKYILRKVEAANSGMAEIADNSNITIEHVLPQNFSQNWSAPQGEDYSSLVYRFGNMILVEEGLNREAGNSNFVVKKDIIARSQFSLAHSVSQRDCWGEAEVNQMQENMARLALKIWRVDLLS